MVCGVLVVTVALPARGQDRTGFRAGFGVSAVGMTPNVDTDSPIILNSGEDWGGLAGALTSRSVRCLAWCCSTPGTSTANGPGLTVGAGYDIWLGRHMAVTPSVNLSWGWPGDATMNSRPFIRGWRQRTFDVGVSLVFY
jgi:hypothetical protein